MIGMNKYIIHDDYVHIERKNHQYTVYYFDRKMKTFSSLSSLQIYRTDTMLEDYREMLDALNDSDEYIAYIPSKDKRLKNVEEMAEFFNVRLVTPQRAFFRHKPEIKHTIIFWCGSKDCEFCRRKDKCKKEKENEVKRMD